MPQTGQTDGYHESLTPLPVALAKLICDIATGQVVDAVEDGKDPVATELGRKDELAQADALLHEQRQEVSRKGASALHSGTAADAREWPARAHCSQMRAVIWKLVSL